MPPLLDRYRAVRAFSEKICVPLHPEDYVIQSMPDASPAKWHLAHTSWFFETFLLKPYLAGYHSRTRSMIFFLIPITTLLANATAAPSAG